MHPDATSTPDLGRQLGELLHEHRELVARLQQGQRHFQELARSVWRVQEDERRRIARELHDGVGHNLAAVIHLLDDALGALPAAGAGHAHDALRRARAIAESTLQDTRALSRLLRPQILDDLGLEAALRWLVRTSGETHGLAVALDFETRGGEPDNERGTLVFRIAQEAIANAAHHAHATRVDVGVRIDANGIALSVRDDGRGCDLQAALAAGRAGTSGGLGGMRDRARLYGGTLQFESAPGAGFRLAMRMPFADLPHAGASP